MPRKRWSAQRLQRSLKRRRAAARGSRGPRANQAEHLGERRCVERLHPLRRALGRAVELVRRVAERRACARARGMARPSFCSSHDLRPAPPAARLVAVAVEVGASSPPRGVECARAYAPKPPAGSLARTRVAPTAARKRGIALRTLRPRAFGGNLRADRASAPERSSRSPRPRSRDKSSRRATRRADGASSRSAPRGSVTVDGAARRARARPPRG